MISSKGLEKAGIDDVVAFLASDFPQMPVDVLRVGDSSARVRHIVTAADKRPGGTNYGQTLKGLADEAL